MSVRFEKFDGVEFDCAPSSPVFIQPKDNSFECFVKELKNRSPILKNLKVPKDFKLFYVDADKDKIEIEDQYDFAIFVRTRITNVTAEYERPMFDDFDEWAEYVKCFTPDGKFPGF